MRKIIAMLLGLSALTPGPLRAAPFVLMNVSETIMTFADQATVRQEGIYRVVWTYTVPVVDLTDGSGVVAAKTQVDCAGERHRDIYMVGYNWDGNSVVTSDKAEEWQLAVPDTSAVRLIRLACKGEARDVLSSEGTFLDVARVVRLVLQKDK